MKVGWRSGYKEEWVWFYVETTHFTAFYVKVSKSGFCGEELRISERNKLKIYLHNRFPFTSNHHNE